MQDLTWCRKGGSRGYVVTRDIAWRIGSPDSGWVFRVAAGREFESSVPRRLHWLFPPDDPNFLKAAAVHDALLEVGHRRAFADSQWVEVALSVGAPRRRAIAAYAAMVLRSALIGALAK